MSVPVPERLPARRRRLLPVWTLLAVLVLAGATATLLVVGAETGVAAEALAAALAACPVLLVGAAMLWLDRHEPEPLGLLLFAAGWGAGVATFGALVVNTLSARALVAGGSDSSLTTVLVAPAVEEVLKGAAVLVVVLLRRDEVDGVVDGMVYAGWAAVGFAFVENVLYLGRSIADPTGTPLLAVFVLRCVVSPFAHPVFTSATGIGLGIAARSRRPAGLVGAPLLGLAAAVALHTLWNLSATSGMARFATGYLLVQLPVLVAFVVVAVLARRREAEVIARRLEPYALTGLLDPGEVRMVASLAERRRALAWARGHGGEPARRAMRDFQDLGTDLAFRSERAARTTGSAEPPDAEQTLYAMALARRGFGG